MKFDPSDDFADIGELEDLKDPRNDQQNDDDNIY